MDRPIETDWSLSCSSCSRRLSHRSRSARCEVFTESADRLVSDLWAWVSVNPKTTLEGLCGVIIDDSPQRAIADSFAEAMRFLPFIERMSQASGQRFKLVKFQAQRTFAEV